MIAWFALGWILLLGKLSGAQAAARRARLDVGYVKLDLEVTWEVMGAARGSGVALEKCKSVNI